MQVYCAIFCLHFLVSLRYIEPIRYCCCGGVLQGQPVVCKKSVPRPCLRCSRLGFANGRHMSSAAELTAANVLGLVVMRCFKRTLSGGAVGAGRLQPLTDLWRGA